MKPLRIYLAIAATAVLVWGGWRVYRARANLVTLNVRSMEVRQVISKVEWQTWERIIVNKNVGGKITLNVKNAPLSEVLNIISLQTDARWTRLYPIYLAGKAAVDFKKVVRGDIPIDGSGWTNLQKSPFWRGGGGGFANNARAANNLVSAQILDKDLDFAALALSRFSQAQVVPEDRANGRINLKLDQVPFEKAVAQVAKQVRRKWDQIYALQPRSAPRVVVNVAPGDTSQPPAPPPAIMVKKEEQIEAFLATMTPEEREKAQEQIAMAAQLESLPPAERQQRMQEMSAQSSAVSQADMERRIQNRLRNGTVDQRIAKDRQKLQKPPRAQN